MNTVTRDGWGVSTQSTSEAPGVILYTYKWRPGLMLQKGAGYRRRFVNREKAYQWALEHGYLQEHKIGWCPWCRERHYFLGKKSGWCPVKKKFF